MSTKIDDLGRHRPNDGLTRRSTREHFFQVDRSSVVTEQEYLAHLNTSFGNWGDGDCYSWVFHRIAGGPPADRIVLREGTVVVAGSAVSYRRAQLLGEEVLVGIMTGSWTLPAARRRGCFTRVIQESLAMSSERGAAALLAFGIEKNSSYRRLREVGSIFRTEYWVAKPSRHEADLVFSDQIDSLDLEPPNVELLWRLHQTRPGSGLRFAYPDLASYRGQFLDRPALVEVVVGAPGRAILEVDKGTERVVAMYPHVGAGLRLVRALLARAYTAGRTLFAFTAQNDTAAHYRACGLVPRPGFLAVLPANETLIAAWARRGGCSVENGDRM